MRRWIAMSAGVILFPGVLTFAACDGGTTRGGSGDSSNSGSGGSSSGSGGAGGGGGSNFGMACGTGAAPTKTNKVDLLFSIDNSRSMADKQAILALALDDLVQSLVNPPCITPDGKPTPVQPASGAEACPIGSQRSFDPVTDMHIGVVSSSLGGHGADACAPDSFTCGGGVTNATNNDKGHLLSRVDPCSAGAVPTYANKGFLAWDPGAKQSPPGEADPTALGSQFKDIVVGVGQIGCGYESQLESWYRFLVDPEPPQSLSIVNGNVEPQGVDAALLAQRAAFLRPDSFLMIVNLTDENDCSIKEYGQFYFAAQLQSPGGGGQFHLPAPRSECAANPNDPCCASCGQATPAGCPDDPTCKVGGATVMLNSMQDPVNLRCFDQKRRFGIDFLYPVDRYVQALTQPMITNRKGELVPNPIFTDLDPTDNLTNLRTADLVALAGIVGVPWQDIARDKTNLSFGYKAGFELLTPAGGKASVWDVVLGDPASYVPPADPLMVESIDPRSGTNPVTSDALAAPGNPNGNPINGSEYNVSAQRDDLQYACVFNLDAPRDCSDPAVISCDCLDANNNNPLCAANPNAGGSKTLQVRAKAYPSLRELAVLRDTCGVVASICPAQTVDPSAGDYAYRPAIRGIVGRIAPHL